LTALLAALRQDSAATADFTESRSLAYLTEPVIVQGQLTYSPNGRLERLVTQPEHEKMVIEGNLLTIEQNPKDPPIRVLLKDHPPLQAFVAALRALLGGDRAALEASFQSTFAPGGGDWRLTLTPKNPALASAVAKIEAVGQAGSLAGIEIAESNGNHTSVTLQPRP
jgi:hypothetical protein